LKDAHAKQALDYACNQGCEWVVLTNGQHWRVSQVCFTKPIDADVILDLDILAINHRKDSEAEPLALLSREAWQKSSLEDYATQKQALSRFTIAAVLLSEPSLGIIRREIRRISKDVKVELADIEKVLRQEVIKREIIEGEKAESAKKLVSKAAKKALRVVEKGVLDPTIPPTPAHQE